jgi:hypothetical protein
MSRLAAFVLAVVVATACGGAGEVAESIPVLLHNNAIVDLCVQTSPRQCTRIAPGESMPVFFRKQQWVDFGMIARLYEWPAQSSGSGGSVIEVQAENDGRLYVVPSGTKLPAQPLPEQPTGFPLAPRDIADLT